MKVNALASHVDSPREEEVILLDMRAEGGAVVHATPIQRAWAATISAGFKKDNKPVVVRDRKIHLHEDMGEAPGLKEALTKTDHNYLTVTMLSDDIQSCISQLFTCYDTVKIFGDQHRLTVMELKNGQQARRVVEAGDPEFQTLLAKCKVSTFIPFALADWNGQDPQIIFPDGYAPYRLRCTSMNSVRSIVDTLKAIKKMTGGRLVGVPLQLKIVNQEKMTPQMQRMKVPVWNLVLKHPDEKLVLGASAIRHILETGIKDAQLMSLPPTISALPAEVLEAAVVNDDTLDTDDEAEDAVPATLNGRDIKTAMEGSAAQTRIDDYFRAMQNTPYTDDAMRAVLVQQMADAAGIVIQTPSLRELAAVANDEEWRLCAEFFCKAAATFHGTEVAKESKPTVADEANPFAKSGASATPTPKAASQEAEHPKAPTINYLKLGRELTEEEIAAAKVYGRTLEGSAAEIGKLTEEVGKDSILFVTLEAKQRGLTKISDIRAMIFNPPEKEQESLL